MDDNRFDRLTKQLATALSRRRLLKGLAVAAVLPASTHVRRAEAKVANIQVCHETGSRSNPWVVISVSEAAHEAHIAHGDRPYVDCCSSADCADGQECVTGACTCDALCGSMICRGTGFVTFTCPGPNDSSCEAVYRDCAAGTACRDAGDGTIECDWQQT